MKNYLRIALARYAHKAWSKWMYYLFSKCALNLDGSMTIPSEFVKRWRRQSTTEYDDLPESEKASDLAEAEEIITAIAAWINQSSW